LDAAHPALSSTAASTAAEKVVAKPHTPPLLKKARAASRLLMRKKAGRVTDWKVGISSQGAARGASR